MIYCSLSANQTNAEGLQYVIYTTHTRSRSRSQLTGNAQKDLANLLSLFIFHKHIQYFTTINLHEVQSRTADFPVRNVLVCKSVCLCIMLWREGGKGGSFCVSLHFLFTYTGVVRGLQNDFYSAANGTISKRCCTASGSCDFSSDAPSAC